MAEQGQGAEGIAKIRQGADAMQAAGAPLPRTAFLTLLAEVYWHTGQTEEGLGVLTEALTLVNKQGVHAWEAELLRLKGELTLTLSIEHQPEAAACFQQALDVARHQQAKSLELRVAMSLSRLWQQQGKRDGAHDLLASVYNWITEGFDTADLKDAKALLEEIA